MDKLDNMTIEYNSSICSGNASEPESFQITTLLYIIPQILLMVFVSFGNILVLLSVRKFPELQTSTNIFVLNLAVADLSIGVISLPLHVIIYIFPVLKSIFVMCMLRYCVVIASPGISVITLVIISIDRYIAIEKPYSYTTIMTSKRSKIVCIGVWVLVLTFTVLPLLGWNQWTPCSECTFSVVLPAGYITIYMSCIFGFVVLIGVFSTKIFLTANAISRDIQNQKASVAGKRNDRKYRNLFLKNTKAAKALIMVFGVFSVCTLPVAIFSIWEANALSAESREMYNVVRICVAFLGFANSGMNPVIYHWRIPEFNTAFRKLLGMKRNVQHTVK